MPVIWIEEEVARSRAKGLKTRVVCLSSRKRPSNPKQLVVLLDEVVGRGDHAERVLFANVAFQTQHADVSILIEKRSLLQIVWIKRRSNTSQSASIVRTEVTWPVVARHHQSESVSSHFSGCFNRNVRIDDRARVHGGNRRSKDVDAFKEERSFFGKEDGKSLVRSDHELIGFNLSEIGIDRKVDGDGRTRNELRGQAGIEPDRFVNDAAGIGSRRHSVWETPKERTKRLVLRKRQTRNQLDGAFDEMPSRPVRWPAWLRLLSMLRENGIHESSSFSNRLMRRKKCAPHELPFACFEAKRFERNRNLNVEAGLVNDAFRFHQQVDTEIFAASFCQYAVTLNAEWIEEHFKGFALIVKGIKKEADVVVLKNVVALGYGRRAPCRARRWL